MHKTKRPLAHTRVIAYTNVNNISSAPEGRNYKSDGNGARIGNPTHDQMLLRRAEKFRSCDEYRHDQTRQRLFELSFESRDLAESEAAIEGEAVSPGSFEAVAGHGAALFGRRSFSLALPSHRAAFELDFAFWEDYLLRSGQIDLLVVLRGIVRGATAEELGVSDRTFRRRVQEIENILSADPPKFRLG